MSEKTKARAELIRKIFMSNPRKQFSISELNEEYIKRGGDKLPNERTQILRAIETIADPLIKKEKVNNKWLFYYDSKNEVPTNDIWKTEDQLIAEERFSEFEAQYIIDSILSCQSFSMIAKQSLAEKIFKHSNVSDEFKEHNLKKLRKFEGILDNSKSETKLKVLRLLSECLESEFVEFDYNGEHITAFPWCFRLTKNGIVLRATKTEDFENKDFLSRYSNYEVGLISNVKKLQSQRLKRTIQCKQIDDHIANKGINFTPEENGYWTLPYENVFLNLRKIRDAIKGKKMIRFYYMPFLSVNVFKEAFTVSPIDCAFSNSKYMLYALNNSGVVKSFRVDFMDCLTIENRAIHKETEKVNIAEHIIHHKKYERVELTIPASHLHKAYEEFGFRGVTVEETTDENDKKIRENYSKYKPSTKRLIKMINGNPPDEFIESNVMLNVTIEGVNEEDAFRFALTHANAVKVVWPPLLRARIIKTAEFMKAHNEKGVTEEENQCLRYFDAINRKILECNEETRQDFMGICDIAESDGRLMEITDVKLSGKEVKSLDSIAKLRGIEYLSLENTEIRNLSELKGFNRLTQLILKNSPIDNWEVLKELPELSSLEVIGIPTDIDVLLKLKNLKQLTLAGTGIKDAGVLLNNPQLPNLAFVIIDGKRYEKKQ